MTHVYRPKNRDFRPTKCLRCGAVTGRSYVRGYCSDACKAAAKAERQSSMGKEEPHLSAGKVDAILDRAVANECAMPWEKHL